MARKKVEIRPKSKKAAPAKPADEWIEGREAGKSPADANQTSSAGKQGSGSQKMKRLLLMCQRIFTGKSR